MLAVIIITATLHDVLKENRFVSGNSFAVQLLHCFSAKRNFATLFSTEDSKDSLSCVHGIRVLTTGWIVLLHVGGLFQIARIIYNRQMLLKVWIVFPLTYINKHWLKRNINDSVAVK